MKNSLLLLIALSISCVSYSQKKDKDKPDSDRMLAEYSKSICKCIDSISGNQTNEAIALQISACIDVQAGTYQMAKKLSEIDVTKAVDNTLTIGIQLDKNTPEYKTYYYEMERYLMANCEAIKAKISSTDLIDHKSGGNSAAARRYYNSGLDATEKKNYKKALELYKKAVVEDPEFAFAYDNIGLSYRQLEDYDNAILAYEQSLRINPNGTMPLQNLAIVYQYKKDYQKSIEAYERLAALDSENPEVFYGIGQVYAFHLNEYEKGLEYMCKAYKRYIELKSPYRADAEKVMQYIYSEMKTSGNEAKFNEILKKHDITPN